MYFISALIMAFGFDNLFAYIFKVPDSRLQNRFLNLKFSEETSVFEKVRVVIYYRIIRFVKLSEANKNRMEKTLMLANIEKTPEEYYATAISGAILGGLLFLPFLAINKLFILFAGYYSYIKYKNYIRKPYDLIEENKKNIEAELFRFATAVEQDMEITTDIISIIENFKNRTNNSFKKQLEITLVEARNTDVEKALCSLEGRVNSEMLSDLSRGLIALSKGKQNQEYFSRLATRFKSIYVNNLKKEAKLLPDKIEKYQRILLFCIMLLAISTIIGFGVSLL